ncbi:hypothetical protein [Methylobacterium iners]|uniref:Uncharacterized protein n=1 Tax=Methylobacterium iners TaxID=418707 RepID=A0ABQ4RTJ5_9HYPH|nr:hypothetical protein [Methylobacterium iners]GJD92907.1 hypothetical protein OCOJLMKI_0090 [Methylobacterium iners]
MNAFAAALRLQEDRNVLLARRQQLRILDHIAGRPPKVLRKLRRLTLESATRRVLGLKGHR